MWMVEMLNPCWGVQAEAHGKTFLMLSRGVENGEKVRFGEDKWWENEALKTLFSRLFRLSCKHNEKIAGFVDVSKLPYNWNLGF